MPKVSIVKCADYNYCRLKEAILKALNFIGGIKTFVSVGDRVLLKPNLLSAQAPERAINTHPQVVKVLAELVKEAGGLPFIGDSPGDYSQKIQRLWEISGMKKVAEGTGAKLLRFENFRKFSSNLAGLGEIPISQEALEMEVIISIPKFKTHSLTILTGAVKNMYGLVSGLTKSELHKKAPDTESFSRVVLEIFSWVKPGLSVMDGILGIEGDGPGSAGKIREIGLILASSDAIALDTVMAELTGIEPFSVPIISSAQKMGLGETNLKNIEVVGEKIDEVKLERFIFPRSTLGNKLLKTLPKLLVRFLARFYRVYPFIKKKCVQCEICLGSCPVQAIFYRNLSLCIDYKKCILCLCCVELCPHSAVVLKRSLLAKVI